MRMTPWAIFKLQLYKDKQQQSRGSFGLDWCNALSSPLRRVTTIVSSCSSGMQYCIHRRHLEHVAGSGGQHYGPTCYQEKHQPVRQRFCHRRRR